MASTLAQLRTKVRDEYIKIDPNGKIRSDTIINAYLNRAYFQLQKDGNHKWRECMANTTTSTVSGTQEYALPADFIRLALVRYAGDTLEKTDKIAIKDQNATMTSGTPYQYYIYGSYIGLFPVPTTIATIDIDYYKKLPTMTSGQVCTLPTDYDEAICAYATYLAFKSVNKINESTVALQDYRLHLDTLLNAFLYSDDYDLRFYYQKKRAYVRSDILA